MKTFRLSALLPLLALAVAVEKATVSDLLKNGAKYDDKAVTVTGKAFDVESKTSRIGNKYFKFRVGTVKEFVSIYGMGKLEVDVKDGDAVEVTGLFRKEKRFKDAVYKNEIEVTTKLGPKFGVKKL